MKQVHVLNHTHWDREWYESFESFRFKLTEGLRYVVDRLQTGQFDNFFLDGQTIVLDDYREVVSADEYEQLVEWIREGKIEVGPWYLLADEFLVAGESLIQNLKIGTKMARQLGSKHDIGYLPDTFGHIGQMPQILEQFGIGHAILWRGAVSDSFENTWIAPNGSHVKTFVLPLFEGYYQTFLKHEAFQKEMDDYLTRNEPFVKSGHYLVMNGADHTFTAPDIKNRLDAIDLPIRQSLMSDYTDAVATHRPTATIHGEQRDPSKIFILPGVLSTRTYLKRDNQLVEDEALNTLGFLNAFLGTETRNDSFREYVWKLILQNQPHDSICGCSIDAVHDEMETRTARALAAMRQFEQTQLDKHYPAPYFGEGYNNQLVVISTVPIERTLPVETTIRIPKRLDLGQIRLSMNGRPIEIDVLRREEKEVFLRHILAEPHYDEYVEYGVVFSIPVEGAGAYVCEIERIEAEVARPDRTDDAVENAFVKVEVDGDGLTITDVETGTRYPGQHVFYSSLDAGDTYNYSPPREDRLTKATLRHATVERGQAHQTMRLEYALTVPTSLDDSRQTGSEQMVTMPITTTVTLYEHDPLIGFKTTVDNKAQDHKLRVAFDVGTCEVTTADTAFDWNERKTMRDKRFDAGKNEECVMAQAPTYSFVQANAHTLVHRGLQEYEVSTYDGRDVVELTMLRAVGWLSRRDLRTRGNGAGPGFEVPGAQCLRTDTFEYGLVLNRENESATHITSFRRRPIVHQTRAAKPRHWFTMTGGVFSSVTGIEPNVSEIRLFNPTTERVSVTMTFEQQVTLERVTLTGDVIERVGETFTVRPKDIVTIRVTSEEK
ncbi:glycoside hydrolase family 38 C-terminal domain-containing protein [Exiguobacterium sp.]|uniref:glycoside hydrolase family 38 N-terminal domain-containing protein n=1 Tax=Exiguobacterium sp. TaxID=44751 RepID=UPI00307E44A3